MITKQQIKQMTSSRFYERGKQIYSTGWMIEKFSVGREDNLDLLEAAVEGATATAILCPASMIQKPKKSWKSSVSVPLTGSMMDLQALCSGSSGI